MKFLILIFFSVMLNGWGIENGVEDYKTSTALPEISSTMDEELCRLSITGYANFEVGRIRVTLSAEAETCDEAAAELREHIIGSEMRIAY